MSTTALAVDRQEHAIAVRSDWESKVALVKRTVAPGLSDEEFQLFCHVAKTRQLDPLQRQIHAVKRRTWNPELGQSGGWEEKMTIQIGIDGFRAIANRTGLYMPSEKLPLVEFPDDFLKMRVTVWVKKFHSASGTWNEFGATAFYREFVQTKKGKDGQRAPVSMWEKMPLTMTEKCAEAKALRRGWPEELGSLYVPEEINGNGDHHHATDPEPQQVMTEGQVADWLAKIEESQTVDELKANYQTAAKAAQELGDRKALGEFETAKRRTWQKRGFHA